MKKSLIVTLALVFVLGIAGTALAANPFVDVPANHWAYAAVAKLAQAGIIDGFGDGTFRGNQNMTRYEMAEITAKAMARSDKADAALKAQIEKLAAEFADELDTLGVRVAKLEKNADNVKITGEARFSNFNYKDPIAGDGDNSTLRTRLWLTGQVNDNWKYVAMIQHNGHDLETNKNEGTQNFGLRRAYVDGMIGDVNVVAGRYLYTPMFGTVLDTDGDGIKVSYNKNKWMLDVFAIRPTFTNFNAFDPLTDTYDFDGKNAQVYGALLGYDFSDRFNMQLAYYHAKFSDKSNTLFDGKRKMSILELGAKYNFSQPFSVWGEYIRADKLSSNNSRNGFAAGLTYSTIDRSQPNTFELRGTYYSVPAGGSIATTSELDITPLGEGFKGWTVGATWMVAKNIDINVDYFDYKTKEGNNDKHKLLWSYVRFYF